jgi:integrase
MLWTPQGVAEWQRTNRRPSAVMVWTPEQTGAFLDSVADDRLYALWHLLAFRALRRGEAAGLRWAEVDLDTGTLTVSRQLVQLGWRVDAGQPKSDAGDRTVALDAGTIACCRHGALGSARSAGRGARRGPTAAPCLPGRTARRYIRAT